MAYRVKRGSAPTNLILATKWQWKMGRHLANSGPWEGWYSVLKEKDDTVCWKRRMIQCVEKRTLQNEMLTARTDWTAVRVSGQNIRDQTFTILYKAISFVCESNSHKRSGARLHCPTDRRIQTQDEYKYGRNPNTALLAIRYTNTPLY
jgi:hypothetical protein